MDDRILLGRRVRELRKSQDFSQEQLAERMGINEKYLSSIERGRENPTLDLLIKLADALNVELVDLFNWPWLSMTETRLRKQIAAIAGDASVDQLREILALMRARDL